MRGFPLAPVYTIWQQGEISASQTSQGCKYPKLRHVNKLLMTAKNEVDVFMSVKAYAGPFLFDVVSEKLH